MRNISFSILIIISVFMFVLNTLLIISQPFFAGVSSFLGNRVGISTSYKKMEREILHLRKENKRLNKQLRKARKIRSDMRKRVRRMLTRKVASATAKGVPVLGTAAVATLESLEILELCRMAHMLDSSFGQTSSPDHDRSVASKSLSLCATVADKILP